MELVAILIVLLAFELAAWRWGVDSSEGYESSEWERRRNWTQVGDE